MPVSRWFSFLSYRFLLTKGAEKYEVINIKDPSQVCYYKINEKGVEPTEYVEYDITKSDNQLEQAVTTLIGDLNN